MLRRKVKGSDTQFLVQCLRAAIAIEFPVLYILYSKLRFTYVCFR